MSVWKRSGFTAGLLARALANPRAMRRALGTAWGVIQGSLGPGVDLTRLPRQTLTDLAEGCPEATRVSMALFGTFSASVSPLETVCLALLARRARAEKVFEFGTYLGVSTTQLALNVERDGKVYTLDLPEDDPRHALEIDDPAERKLTEERNKGGRIPEDLKGRIIFLRQDSAAFDETPYAGQMDLVFVDGAHSADYVRNDSEKGWRMLRSGGVIVWHDCRPQDPDVAKYLCRSPFKPKWIDGTSLAFADKA